MHIHLYYYAGTDNDNSKSDHLSPQEVTDAVNGNCDAIKHEIIW